MCSASPDIATKQSICGNFGNLKKFCPVFLLILLITLIAITVWMYLAANNRAPQINEIASHNIFSKKTTTTPNPSATPPPTTLTKGPGVYNISQGNHVGPTISKVTFNPLDAKKDQLLTITLEVNIKDPADKITGTLQTDSSVEPLAFNKSSTNDNYQIWTTSLTLPEPVLYKYILTLTSSSSSGSSQVIVAPRS